LVPLPLPPPPLLLLLLLLLLQITVINNIPTELADYQQGNTLLRAGSISCRAHQLRCNQHIVIAPADGAWVLSKCSNSNT